MSAFYLIENRFDEANKWRYRFEELNRRTAVQRQDNERIENQNIRRILLSIENNFKVNEVRNFYDKDIFNELK